MYARNSLSFQLGPFRFMPWTHKFHDYCTCYADQVEDCTVVHCYAGWLCFQIRWILVN